MQEDKSCDVSIICNLCHYTINSIFVCKHKSRHQKLLCSLFRCISSTPELYKCSICGFETGLKANLSGHLLFSHRGKERNDVLPRIMECYKCENCSFNTYSLLVLLKHKGQDLCENSPEPEVIQTRRFKCDHCSYQAKRKPHLTQHIIYKHTRPEEAILYKCEKCVFKAKTKGSLQKHVLRQHFPEKVKWHKCMRCTFQTKTKANLRNHVWNRHNCPEEISWYECETCSHKTKTKSELKVHVLYNHTDSKDIKWFEC